MRVKRQRLGQLASALLAIFLVLVGLAHPAEAYTAKGVGVVTALRGDVAVAHVPEVATRELRPPQEPLRFRSDVFFRDVIDTQREATAKLLLRGQATLTIRELSRVELREGVVPTDPTRSRSIVSLLAGAFRAITSAALLRGDELEVQTPNAVAAIRGTDVWVEFYPPGTTLPPLPVASLEPRVQRASFQLAQAAPQDNTRIFVLVGQSCVAGVCAGPGEALEMVGNLPPRLFRFALDYIQGILGTLVLGLHGPTGKDYDQVLAALQGLAARDVGGGRRFFLSPGCTTLACATVGSGVIAGSGLPNVAVNSSFPASFFLGSLDIPSLVGSLGPGKPFISILQAQTSVPFFSQSGTANVNVSGTLSPLGFGNLTFTLTATSGTTFTSTFSGPMKYDGKSLVGSFGGSFTGDTCGDGCIASGSLKGTLKKP